MWWIWISLYILLGILSYSLVAWNQKKHYNGLTLSELVWLIVGGIFWPILLFICLIAGLAAVRWDRTVILSYTEAKKKKAEGYDK